MAAAYAAMGWSVLPLHTPLPGGGCSCGNPGCKHPGKHPRTLDGFKDATTDLNQIERWWQRWPDANIGVVPGSAGLLVLDFDQHSEKFGPDAQALLDLLRAEHPTLEAVSGSGSSHLWFRLHDGEEYTSYTGTLPKGIDVRSSGGYVVVAPSLHHSGNRYQWAGGDDLSAVAPLPDIVRRMLRAERQGHKVTFAATTTVRPDLAALGLSSALIEKIHTVPPVGQRSEYDFAVVRGLLRAGLDDDTILAIFEHYPIGQRGKFAERRDGRRYLATTIGNARAAGDHTLSAEERATLAAWAAWAESPAFAEALANAGLRNAKAYAKLLAALVQTAEDAGTMTPFVSTRKLGELAGLGRMAVQRMMQRMMQAGIVKLATEKRKGTLADLSELCISVTDDHTPLAAPPVESVTLMQSKFVTHMADDVFSDYPHHLAVKRWNGRKTARALGVNALALWDAVDHHGPQTVKGFQTVTGLREWAVRRAAARLEEAGLLIAYRQGRAYCYDLHPDFDHRLDGYAENVATHGIGQFRAMQNDLAAADFAERQRQRYTRRGAVVNQPEHDRWQARRDVAAQRAMQRRDWLESIGFAVKLPKTKAPDPEGIPYAPKPRLLKIDPASEWERKWRPIWLRWLELDEMPRHERLFVLEAEGHSAEDVDKTLTYWAARMVKPEATVDYFGMD